MRVALYARYSSERQNERSISDQHAVCRRHADARGWDVVAAFQDAAISGAAMANRPGLLAMLAAAEAAAFDLVLVEDEDRLARSQEHLAHVASRLEFAGVALATLETDQVDDMRVAFKGLIGAQYLKVLRQKTARGMRSNAEKGLATGSRLYGYRSAPGGELAIIPAEAEVIRRIFADFAAGLTGRDIAAGLNREGIAGPRGGRWNRSSITGSRQRANGVLNTELYAGVKVYNRMEVRKDPRTGKRLPRMRPVDQWLRTPVPHLAIVDAEAWATAQARKAREGGGHPHQLAGRRQPGLFSGLVKCGVCGGGYVTANAGRLQCATRRERGPAGCGNARTVKRAHVEARVLEGLRTRLMRPAAVAAYVRAYHAAWTALEAARADRRAPIDRRLAEIARSSRRIVDAVAAGVQHLGHARPLDGRGRRAPGARGRARRHRRRRPAAGPVAPPRGRAVRRPDRPPSGAPGRGRRRQRGGVDHGPHRRPPAHRRHPRPGRPHRGHPAQPGPRRALRRHLARPPGALPTPARGTNPGRTYEIDGSWGRDRTADLWVMNPPL